MIYQKNDIVTVTIEDMGNDGEGIGRVYDPADCTVSGFTFFVKDAVIGDTVEARVVKPKKHYAYARLERVLVPSPYRVKPRCAFHRQCGGCQIQALSYGRQLKFKQDKVRNNLIRLGGFSSAEADAALEPIVGMDEPYHYRNKALFPIGKNREGKLVAGFYAGRTHDIIANTDCHLGVPENRIILETVLSFMEENNVTAYDETTGKGLVRHVLIRKGFASGQLMVCLVINGKKLPAADVLIGRLKKIQGVTSICINSNMENTNVVMGAETHVLWGSETIEDFLYTRNTADFSRVEGISPLKYHISAQSFYQVNPIQTEKLYSLALEYAALTGKETVWDLYCGIGTISLFLARQAKHVYGVEVVPQAIEDARRNAADNGICNAEFYVGKAEDVLFKFYEESQSQEAGGGRDMKHPDVIVVDPPRKGCDAVCLETMLAMRPERIVYVSCDSATLARDLRILADGGYCLERVRPVDQFPQGVHVETCVLLSRKRSTTRIEIEMDLTEADRRECIGKATYQEIKDYIWEHYQTKVSHLYIAQIKKKCGLDVGENYNKPKTEGNRVPNCPPEKEKMITEALKFYGMVK